jgi:hypothetical protein
MSKLNAKKLHNKTSCTACPDQLDSEAIWATAGVAHTMYVQVVLLAMQAAVLHNTCKVNMQGRSTLYLT